MREKIKQINKLGIIAFCPTCGHSEQAEGNPHDRRCLICGTGFDLTEATQTLGLDCAGNVQITTVVANSPRLGAWLMLAPLRWDPTPVAETLMYFDWRHQLDKLKEEVAELAEQLERDPQMFDKDFISECADVKNMIEAVDMTTDGLVTRMADTKMLRTQIRVRQIIKDRKEECLRRQGANR